MANCGTCGGFNEEPDDAFCGSCGATLAKATRVTAAASPPAAEKAVVAPTATTSRSSMERLAAARAAEAVQAPTSSHSPPPADGAADANSAVVSTAALLSKGRPKRTSSRGDIVSSPTVNRHSRANSAAGSSEPITVPRLSVPGSRNSLNLGVRSPVSPTSHASCGDIALSPAEAAAALANETKPKTPTSGSLKGETRSRLSARMSSRSLSWFDEKELAETMGEVFHADSYSGWLLVGYQPDNLTLELQACGDGSVKNCLEFLDDAQQQYIMLRLAVNTSQTLLENKKTRDVLIVWQGPKVPIMNRGRFAEHIPMVKDVLKPVHAHLVAKSRTNLTDQTILNRSEPGSGSHEIE